VSRLYEQVPERPGGDVLPAEPDAEPHDPPEGWRPPPHAPRTVDPSLNDRPEPARTPLRGWQPPPPPPPQSVRRRQRIARRRHGRR
jgi:hypothetical protein